MKVLEIVQMPYRFTFDLRSLPRSFFQEIIKLVYDSGIHQRLGVVVKSLIRKFRIQEVTGLNLLDAITLFEDFLEIQAINVLNRERFNGAHGRRALFLPHCARKYMDNRCKAIFDQEVPTYRCQRCSPDCLISQATKLAAERNYDVYVVPGGSCISKILGMNDYRAVVAVACGTELKLGYQMLEELGVPGQAVPLLKNGCAGTWFDMEELMKIL